MPNTIEQVIAYARSHLTNNGATWHNWCEAFVFRAGGFTRSFGRAQWAANASGPLNPNFTKAPRGAIHYWSDASGFGHVGFELGGGLVLMASNGVTTLWGTAMGTATVPDYNRNKPDMHYLGWSMRHGTETLAMSASSTASVSKPIPVPVQKSTRKKRKMPEGFMTTNHGVSKWGVGVEKGVWYDVPDQDSASAIRVANGIPAFAIVSVAVFQNARNAYLGTPAA